AIKNACIIGQQILLLRPNAREWFSPKLDTYLPIWCDRTRWQRAFNREQGIIGSQLLQTKGCFILADLDLCRWKLMVVDPNVCWENGGRFAGLASVLQKVAL